MAPERENRRQHIGTQELEMHYQRQAIVDTLPTKEVQVWV